MNGAPEVSQPQNPLPEIRAITLDVGGTLITPWPSVGHIYAESALTCGQYQISPQTLNQRFIEAWSSFKSFNHTRSDWAKLVDLTFAGLIDSVPSSTFFSALYDRFGEPEVWRIFDDVVPALESFARLGLKMGILSNWDERLRPLLHKLKLHDYFDAIIISCEAGAWKPSGAIFGAAAQALGVPADSILHVGDSLNHDAEGARAAGFQALLIDRSGNTTRGDGPISSLRELYP